MTFQWSEFNTNFKFYNSENSYINSSYYSEIYSINTYGVKTIYDENCKQYSCQGSKDFRVGPA